MATYVPGTLESDPKKIVMSLQQVGPRLDGAVSDIATLQTDAASFVVGPATATNNGFAVFDGTTGKLVKNHASTVALGSEVSGTLPVANGGTGDTGTAWSAYTPTITAFSGTFTSVSATGRYRAIGKTIFISVTVSITTNGTAASFVRASIPLQASSNGCVMAGRANGVSGKMIMGFISAGTSEIAIFNYDGSYPGANGEVLVLSGVYEST